MQRSLVRSLLSLAMLGIVACDSPSQPGEGPAVEVTVSPTTATLAVGQALPVTATVANATNLAVTWQTANPAVATVTAGVITGVAPGTTEVSAVSVADPTKRASVQVTVTPLTTPTAAIVPSSTTLAVGQTRTLVTTGFPAGTVMVWTSDAPAVATVDGNGLVRAIASGLATITARSAATPTISATATVTVNATGTVTMPVLGLGAVPERYTAEVAVRGNIAYTTTWFQRVAGVRGNMMKIWNVAGNTPVLIDSVLVNAATGTTGDVQISDDGALLVVAMEGGGSTNGITIYNRGSNPEKPTLIRHWTHAETAPGVHTVKLGRVSGRHYAFLSINPGGQGARLIIVDITDPANPAFVWSQTMGSPYVHDVFVRDGILFAALWDAGLRIYDIGGGGRGGSPSAPVVMGSVTTATGNIHNVWWFHDPTSGGSGRKYVFLGEEGTDNVGVGAGTSHGDIHVIDVSNMSAPVQVAQFAVNGAGAHNFWMDEPSGILYAAYYNGGVRALDVRGDLGACTAAQKNAQGFCDLRLMGREAGVALPAGAYVWGVVHQGTHVYASDMKAGLYKLDASALKR